MLLGSLAGIGVSLALTAVLAARITGEEKMLVDELDGYMEYRKKVRYRLMPGVW